MGSRFRFDLLLTCLIPLSLVSCLTAPSTRIDSVTHHHETNGKAVQSQEAAADDTHLTNALPGPWVYESDSVERMEGTFLSDGNFEFFHLALTLRGAEERSVKGTWKIQNGQIIVSGHYEQPNNSSQQKINFGKIISIADSEFTLIQGQRKLVLKKKQPEDYLLKELALKSRMRERLSITANRLLRNFDKGFEIMPPARLPNKQTLAAMRSFMAAAFDPERLEQTILRELSTRVTAEDIRRAIDWHETSLGKKCKELLIKASLPDSDTEMEAFIDNLRENPGPPERTKLIQELIRSCKLTEAQVNFAQSMELAFTMGGMALLPPDNQIPINKITEEMERNRPMLMVMVEPLILGNRLYSLRSLSTPELREFVRYAISDFDKRVGVAYNSAFDRAMLDATDRYLKSIKWAVDYEQQRKNKVSGA